MTKNASIATTLMEFLVKGENFKEMLEKFFFLTVSEWDGGGGEGGRRGGGEGQWDLIRFGYPGSC